MDCREQFITKITRKLIEEEIDPQVSKKVINSIILELEGYILSELTTELTIPTEENEKLLKLYCGTLLTEGKSRRTVYTYSTVIKRFLEETNKSIFLINVFDIRIWLAKKQQEISLRTCENYRSYLSAFFKWLASEEIIEKNPMEKIKPIKYIEQIKKPFSEVELDALRRGCKTLRERAEFEVLISSGVRVSELGGLNISDINFNDLSVLVRNGKGGKQRITYINELAKHHLLIYLNSRTDNEDCLFLTKLNTRLSKSSAENDLKRIGRAAQIENVHPHRCRRTFATSLFKKGMDLHTIQKLMGHSDINTTKGYLSLDDDFIKNQYKHFLD